MIARLGRIGIVFLVLCVCGYTPGLAVSPGFWESGDLTGLGDGFFEGIAINHEGHLSLSLQYEIIAEFDYPVFSIVPRQQDSYLVGTGDVSTIHTCVPGSEPELSLELNGLAVTSMSRGPDNRIYFVNQQNHSLDIFVENSEPVTFCSIPETYIWDMVWDDDGNLFVATGDAGRIYRINAKGEAELYFDSEEDHIMVLAKTPDGRLLAGSEGNGIVYLIESKDKVKVLFDSPSAEISAIAVASNGDVYFSAIPAFTAQYLSHPSPSTQGQSPHQSGNNGQEGTQQPDQIGDMVVIVGQPQPASQKAGDSSLYYAPVNGTPRKIWTCAGKLIFSLALDSKDRLFIGTGNDASLFSLDKQFKPVLLHKFTAENILSFETDPDGSLLIGTSGPGTLIRMSGQFCSKGEYVSEPFNAAVPSVWGELTVRAGIPRQTRVNVFFRSGNSAEPDQTWSDWSSDIMRSTTYKSLTNVALYAQYKVQLFSSSPKTSPHLYGLSVSYQQLNVPPTIIRFQVVEPALPWFQSKETTNFRQAQAQINSIFPIPKSGAAAQALQKSSKRDKLTKRKLKWFVTDANKDRLLFDLYIQPEDSTRWMTVAENISLSHYKLDTDLLPDGIYSLKLVASDRRTNSEQSALQDYATISFFMVDNTSPVVKITKADIQRDGCLLLEGSLEDSQSRVLWGEYSLNGKDWVFFQARDAIYDQNNETFTLSLCSLEKGEQSIIVQATDEFYNKGRALKVVVFP